MELSFYHHTTNCREENGFENSGRIEPFTFSYTRFFANTNENHAKFIEKLLKSASRLAQSVNPGAANNPSEQRKFQRLLANAAAGLLAEFCWKKYINSMAGILLADYAEFETAATQTDLIITTTGKRIEVRSSFPRNKISFALCHPRYEFDILGPYSNSVKPGEIQKDFYLRTLYYIPDGTSFLDYLKQDKFPVFLTGGATWEMMTDDRFSKNKDLLPEDSISLKSGQKATYRVVPFSKALDTSQMIKKMIG